MKNRVGLTRTSINHGEMARRTAHASIYALPYTLYTIYVYTVYVCVCGTVCVQDPQTFVLEPGSCEHKGLLHLHTFPPHPLICVCVCVHNTPDTHTLYKNSARLTIKMKDKMSFAAVLSAVSTVATWVLFFYS